MILPAGPLRIYIATRPVDFRKGMDGLAALAQAQLRLDPFSGAVLVFRAKRADRVKILVFDGTGLCLYSKRLEAGRFRWPSPAEGTVRLTALSSRRCSRACPGPNCSRADAAAEHRLVSGNAGFLGPLPVKSCDVAGAG